MSSSCLFNHAPREIILHIFSYLNPKDQSLILSVSKLWKKILLESSLEPLKSCLAIKKCTFESFSSSFPLSEIKGDHAPKHIIEERLRIAYQLRTLLGVDYNNKLTLTDPYSFNPLNVKVGSTYLKEEEGVYLMSKTIEDKNSQHISLWQQDSNVIMTEAEIPIKKILNCFFISKRVFFITEEKSIESWDFGKNPPSFLGKTDFNFSLALKVKHFLVTNQTILNLQNLKSTSHPFEFDRHVQTNGESLIQWKDSTLFYFELNDRIPSLEKKWSYKAIASNTTKFSLGKNYIFFSYFTAKRSLLIVFNKLGERVFEINYCTHLLYLADDFLIYGGEKGDEMIFIHHLPSNLSIKKIPYETILKPLEEDQKALQEVQLKNGKLDFLIYTISKNQFLAYHIIQYNLFDPKTQKMATEYTL